MIQVNDNKDPNICCDICYAVTSILTYLFWIVVIITFIVQSIEDKSVTNLPENIPEKGLYLIIPKDEVDVEEEEEKDEVDIDYETEEEEEEVEEEEDDSDYETEEDDIDSDYETEEDDIDSSYETEEDDIDSSYETEEDDIDSVIVIMKKYRI